MTCSVGGCTRQHEARGWCGKHYRRWRRHGDPLVRGGRPRGRTGGTTAERPAANSLTTSTGCVEWTGGVNEKGYGRMKVDGRTESVHRVAWQLANGSIPPGQVIRHLVCDNPPCFNVEHLAPGTNAENVADRVGKGRSAAGAGRGSRTLTWDLVDAMRADLAAGMSLAAAAAKYGVAKSLVGRIRLGQAWDPAKRAAS